MSNTERWLNWSASRHYSLKESETKTEFVCTEDGLTDIIVEENCKEMKCRVIARDYPEYGGTITCASVDDTKRCRSQLVRSFAQFAVPDYAEDFIAEDNEDRLKLMGGRSGLYEHFVIRDQHLAGLQEQFATFRDRYFPNGDCVRWRLLVTADQTFGYNDFERVFDEFAAAFHTNEREGLCQLRLFGEACPQGVYGDVDIWVFPE